MKINLFLALLLSLSSASYADCIWNGNWCVYADGSKSSKPEYAGQGIQFRHWEEKSYEGSVIKKCYQFDCETKTWKLIELTESPLPSSINFEDFLRLKATLLSEMHYFSPDDGYQNFCNGVYAEAAEYAEKQKHSTDKDTRTDKASNR